MYLYAFHYRFRHSDMGTIEGQRRDYDRWDGIAEMPAASFEGDHLVHEFYDDGGSIRVKLERDDGDPRARHVGVAHPTEDPQTDKSLMAWGKHKVIKERRVSISATLATAMRWSPGTSW